MVVGSVVDSCNSKQWAWAIRCGIAGADEENDEWFNRNKEEVILPRIKRSFREWEQSFKTMKEQSSSERAWSEWLDALEIFWWLGHRKEAWEIAGEVRDFSFDGDRNRLLSVQRWNPESEKLVYDSSGYFKERSKVYFGDFPNPDFGNHVNPGECDPSDPYEYKCQVPSANLSTSHMKSLRHSEGVNSRAFHWTYLLQWLNITSMEHP